MAMSAFPALVKPFQYDNLFKVNVQLDNTHLGPCFGTKAGTKMDLLAMCSQLDWLCQKELTELPENKIRKGNVTIAFSLKASEITTRMEQISKSIPESSSAKNILSKNSFLWSLYPRAAIVVADQTCFNLNNSKCDMDDYFADLAGINQIYTLSKQIKGEMSKGDTLQLAHKVSLLFQSLNGIGQNSVYLDAKKSIEENFPVLKANLKNQSELQPSVKKWVNHLLSGIMISTSGLPSEITNCMLKPALLMAYS